MIDESPRRHYKVMGLSLHLNFKLESYPRIGAPTQWYHSERDAWNTSFKQQVHLFREGLSLLNGGRGMFETIARMLVDSSFVKYGGPGGNEEVAAPSVHEFDQYLKDAINTFFSLLTEATMRGDRLSILRLRFNLPELVPTINNLLHRVGDHRENLKFGAEDLFVCALVDRCIFDLRPFRGLVEVDVPNLEDFIRAGPSSGFHTIKGSIYFNQSEEVSTICGQWERLFTFIASCTNLTNLTLSIHMLGSILSDLSNAFKLKETFPRLVSSLQHLKVEAHWSSILFFLRSINLPSLITLHIGKRLKECLYGECDKVNPAFATIEAQYTLPALEGLHFDYCTPSGLAILTQIGHEGITTIILRHEEYRILNIFDDYKSELTSRNYSLRPRRMVIENSPPELMQPYLGIISTDQLEVLQFTSCQSNPWPLPASKLILTKKYHFPHLKELKIHTSAYHIEYLLRQEMPKLFNLDVGLDDFVTFRSLMREVTRVPHLKQLAIGLIEIDDIQDRMKHLGILTEELIALCSLSTLIIRFKGNTGTLLDIRRVVDIMSLETNAANQYRINLKKLPIFKVILDFRKIPVCFYQNHELPGELMIVDTVPDYPFRCVTLSYSAMSGDLVLEEINRDKEDAKEAFPLGI